MQQIANIYVMLKLFNYQYIFKIYMVNMIFFETRKGKCHLPLVSFKKIIFTPLLALHVMILG